jgi:hypothetical protein
MPSQKQNISIGNATRILNEHPICLMPLKKRNALHATRIAADRDKLHQDLIQKSV